jgi:hypothetical protein
MYRPLAGGLVAAVALLLAACGSSSSSSEPEPPPPPPPPGAQVQVVHAAADAPDVNVLIDGAVPEGLAGVPFAAASPYLELPAGTVSAAVNALLPDGSEAEVLAVPELELISDVAYTVIAAGSTAALLSGAENENPLQLFVLERSVVESIAGARLQVLHGAPGAPEVDVYVGAPDAPLGDAATFGFGEVLELGVVPAGDYRIRVTPAGSGAVVFDSGTVALPEGADLSVIAVDNTGPASPQASPIVLLAVFADGTVATLRDGGAEAAAGLAAVHNAADAPAVCVVADDASTADIERVELFAGVPFRGFGYLGAVPPGSYLVGLEVFDAQDGCSGTAVVTFDEPVELEPGVEATGIVVGTLGGGLELLALPDDLRAIATEARVRIVHGASAVPGVDIYVVAPGTDITDPAVEPAFAGVEFGQSTGFVSLAPGAYDVFVTLAGDTTPAIAVPGLELEAGQRLTAIASDPAGDEAAPGLVVIDYGTLKADAGEL